MPSVYGTYLCKEPPDHFLSPASDRLELLRRSAEYFSKREQLRAFERLQYEISQVHIKNKQWGDAIRILFPLWQTLSWRREGWWNLVEKVDMALRECTRCVGDGEILIAVEWELLSGCFESESRINYEFSKCLDGLKLSRPHPKTVLQAESVVSCISASFAFGLREGHVGEALPAQLVISSRAHLGSAPITLTQIKLAFGGGLKDVNIQHDSEEAPQVTTSDGLVHLHNVSLQKASIDNDDSTPSSPIFLHDSQSLLGATNLSFSAGVTKALSFISLPHNAGTVEAVSITLCIKEEFFELEIIASEEIQLRQENLWVETAAGLSKIGLGKERSNIIKILPKPPKMRIEILDLVKPYLTDEIVSLNIQLINEEEEDTDVSLEIRLHDQSETAPGVNWAFEGAQLERSKVLAHGETAHDQSGSMLANSLGKMSPLDTCTCKLSLQAVLEAAQYGLEVKACYHLLSDPETPILKTFVTSIVFIRPFEANCDFLPRVSAGPWPTYFHVTHDNEMILRGANEDPKAAGLSQRWLLVARITSFAAEPMLVEDAELRVLDVQDQAICKIKPSIGCNEKAVLISPDHSQENQFELEIQKIDLEDRRSAVLSLQLEVRWRQEGSDKAGTTTIVAVPEVVISFGEPRVLASAHTGQGDDGLIHLDYVIENPSMHILTFKLNMEPSDDFAFSGARDSLLQLAPLSRNDVRYNLLPLVRGTWINPQFKVMDIHFRKMLKVNATEGMRSDKKGALIWVDAEG